MNLGSTQDVVVEVLQRASSQNPDVLKPAEIKLREWEIQPGFYTVLYVRFGRKCYYKLIIIIFQNVLSNHSLDVNVRWMAVLYMKNGIDRYWRKNAQK